ncbi:MAG: hypothetical protein AB1486_32060 [Planctomycetota bacterium]
MSAQVRSVLGFMGLLAFAAAGCRGLSPKESPPPPPTVMRTEGPKLPLAPQPLESSVLFPGEGEGASRAAALDAALAQARAQALGSIRTEVHSRVEQVMREQRVDAVLHFDQRLEHELETEAAGCLEGSRQHGEPYAEYLSDGTVRVRVLLEVPKSTLDPHAFVERELRRQALEARRRGQLAEARDAFKALLQLRPADALLFVHLSRIEEDLAAGDGAGLARAREYLRQALACNGGEPLIDDPDHPGSRLDLAAEIERLTPLWDELIAQLLRLEEQTRDRESFSLASQSDRYFRSSGVPVELRLFSRDVRSLALLWIDGDGLFPLEAFGDGGSKHFSRVQGAKMLEQELGTVNGLVRIVALAVEDVAGAEKVLVDIERLDVVSRKSEAVGRVQALCRYLEAESRGATLRVACAEFEIVP